MLNQIKWDPIYIHLFPSLDHGIAEGEGQGYTLIQGSYFLYTCRGLSRLAPVLKTNFHQCVISYTFKTEPSELDRLQVYDMTH